MARIVTKPTRAKSKKTKRTNRTKRTKRTNKRAQKPPLRLNKARNSDQRRPMKIKQEKSKARRTIAERHPRGGHVIQKQIKFLGQPIFESVKARKENRKGNFEKAIKIEIAYQKQVRSRRKKGYYQKRDWYMKTSDSRTHIDPYADKDDDYWQNDYNKIPLECDEEPWYIKELWGNGVAQKWNEELRFGLPCPHIPPPPIDRTEEDEF